MSCGYCCPLWPHGAQYSGVIRLIEPPGGIWTQETCAGCPKQRYATGKPGKVQRQDRLGIVERSRVYLARGVSVRGKFILTRNPGYKTSGVAMWLNVHSSDPRVAYPEVKVQVWDLPRAGPGVERIGRTPPPLAQSVETWPIGVRLVCRELRPVSLEERILVIERVGCGRHATHYFGLNFS